MIKHITLANIFYFGGVATILISIAASYGQHKIYTSGLETQASVYHKDITKSGGWKFSTEHRHYNLYYQFKASDGKEYKDRTTISSIEWEQTRIGDRLDVLYLEDDPEESLTPKHAASYKTTLVLFSLIGGFIIWCGYRQKSPKKKKKKKK